MTRKWAEIPDEDRADVIAEIKWRMGREIAKYFPTYQEQMRAAYMAAIEHLRAASDDGKQW